MAPFFTGVGTKLDQDSVLVRESSGRVVVPRLMNKRMFIHRTL